MSAKIVIAGGTGFVGSALAKSFRSEGAHVIVLTRAPSRQRPDGVRELQWTATPTPAPEPWVHELDGADALINLAGATIRCRHTPENRRKILDSRLSAVRALGNALRSCRRPPAAWIQASAVGYYGDRGNERCDETSAAGRGFLADVCREWEGSFSEACPAVVRPIVLRLGIVLAREGGAYPELEKLARCFVGGAAGNGRQGISWILLEDVVAIIRAAIATREMRGTYNATAPEPVSNAEFMRALRKRVHRPWSPPAPAFMVKLGASLMGVDPSLALEGQYAIPARLIAEGFEFRARNLDEALGRLAII